MSAPTPEQIAAAMEALAGKLLGPGGEFELVEKSWPIGSPGEEKWIQGQCYRNNWTNLRRFYDDSFGRYGDRTFIVYDDERLTFDDIWSQASALGHQLVEQYQISQGDRVAVCMRNYPEWCITFIAVTSVGGVIVPLNSWWKGDELKYGLQDSGSKVIVLDEERLNRVRPFLSKLNVSAILVRAENILLKSNVAMWSKVLAAGQGHTCPENWGGPDEYAAIMYTSGSTGHPKGVVLSNRGICNQLRMNRFISAMASGMTGVEPPLSVNICPVPLFHATASHHIFLANLCVGGKIVLMRKWDAGVALQLIHREKPTSWIGVPTMVQDLMEHPDFDKADTSSLGRIGGGGAPTPTSQVTKTKKKFKGGEPSQGYGLTETNGGICGIGGDEYLQRPTSTGKPFAITEVVVVDADTLQVLPPGQQGELLIKGVLVMSHYWNKNEKTRKEVIDLPGRGSGWFRSGDIAELDEEGYIYIRDRVKDIIIRGGENISCAEVESGFFKNCEAQVLECSAFGLKDERLGEEVGVVVVLKPNVSATAEQMISQIKKAGTIASFKIPKPKNIFFSQDILPRTASGKIMKRTIRDAINTQIAEGRRQQVISKL